MRRFFNPQEYSEELIPSFGTVHLVAFAIMILLLVLVLTNKEKVKKLAANERFMKILVWGFLSQEILWNIILWIYKYQPVSGRFPLHLCAILSIIIPILLLRKNYSAFKFFAYWAVCAGFISFANPSFQNVHPFSFHFIQYCIRHYFLFVMPVFMQIGFGYKHNYREFLRSVGALTILSFIVFILDWVTGANFMYIGQNSDLSIPFLPAGFTVWPWVYPSFIGTGVLLLHIAYLVFSRMGRKGEVVNMIEN